LRRGRAVAGLLLLLAPACSPAETACTLIGSVSGVSVTVDRAIAADVNALKLRVCWDLSADSPPCRDTVVALSPGSDSVDQGCDSTDPDAACSATVVPNGTKVGFAQVDQLSVGPVTVVATATGSTGPQRFPRAQLTAASTFPNGRDCGPGGPQVTAVLDSQGLR
jgi:hypothetical protein